MKKFLIYKALLVIFLGSLNAVWGKSASVSDILLRINQKKASVGVAVLDAETGRVLYRKNEKKPMIPASNMKIVTTAAALHYLGEDYKFITRIGMIGSNLIVLGGGDPLFGDPVYLEELGTSRDIIFQDIISSLRQAGISSIQDIIIDATFFDNNRVHPSWPPDQLNRWYACEISGLNFNNNCIHILAKKEGSRAIVTVDPATSYVTLINQIKTVSSGSSGIGAYRNGTPNKLSLKGRLRTKSGMDVAIEDPAAFFGYLLYEKLAKNNIPVKGKLVHKYVKNRENIRFLKTFETPIRDVLIRCNRDSLGLAAEALVKTISAENTKGRFNGEWPHGQELIKRYLKSMGITADQFVLDDGGGLSRKNRISPYALAIIFQKLYQAPQWELFQESLACGGQDGTLERYFNTPPYRGNILGKTGYISGIRTFSGTCRTEHGRLVFSILTEGGGSSVRTLINDVAKAIYHRRWQ